MNTALTPEKTMQTEMCFWPSKTLLSAVELGVFTTLGAGARSFETLGAALKPHPRGGPDFLDEPVVPGFLERTAELYRNAADTELFLDRNKPTYIGGILAMTNSRLYPFWDNLTEALRAGKPQNALKSKGSEPFDAFYADPDWLRKFLGAMTGVSQTGN